MSTFFPYAVVGLFGLVFGSFLNVCIVRLPHYESVVTPRSHCPRCGQTIRWFDNIPVLSYIVLRARCRYCHEAISPLYPTVEILTAGVLVLTWARYDWTPEFVKMSVLGMLLVVLIFTDLTERRIPHKVTLFGIVVGLLLSLFVDVDDRLLEWVVARWGLALQGTLSSLLGAVSGAAFGGGFFYVVAELFYRLRHKEGLGFGDVMLMLMVGTFLGVPLTLMTIMLGSVLGTLVAGPLHLASPRFRNYQWPFGTFLGLAAIFAGLEGQSLLQAYLHFSGYR